MKTINFVSISFGADPEFFFSKGGKIIGSEKVLPKDGVHQLSKNDNGDVVQDDKLIVIDGVQAEFNVLPSTCRQSFSGNLRSCFLHLYDQMQQKGVEADFSQSIKISEEELKTLDKQNQKFGCSPSKNAYKESKIDVNPLKYTYRSAGGHLHFGDTGSSYTKAVLAKHKEVVQMLDIIVGNTCVLLDRDEGNIERRKVYGKAGEYRTPAHGLEYRTLSNFWMRSYQLMSFVLALSRFAISVANDNAVSKEILSKVDMAKIQKAINKNDYDLAYENFNQIKDIIADIGLSNSETYFPLQAHRMKSFELFVAKGINFWFPQDTMTHWMNSDNLNNGWERFIDNIVPKLVSVEKPIGVIQVARRHLFTGFSSN